MIKEAFATIKTLFEEFGLSDLFADRTKEDSLFGKIMLAIDKQASRIGTEQMIIINNLCSVIPLDNTNTLDTQYVNSELVKIFFNNKILNPNAATMLMK